MKRKVLATKQNKKALNRVLAANSGTHSALKPPYNVLVDSSLVRLAVKDKNSGIEAPLSKAFEERAFGLEARVFYHPATYTRVEKTCPEGLNLLATGTSDVTRVKFPTTVKKSEASPKGERHPLEERERNEEKAIVDFITKERRVEKRLWFVASVNHDLRMKMANVAPTIRLTVKPTNMFIEPQTATSTNSGTSSMPSVAQRSKRNREDEDREAESTEEIKPEGSFLNAAVPKKDAAFMKKLGVSVPQVNTGEEGSKKFKAKFQRRVAKGVNPMANKKKKPKTKIVS